MNKTPGILIIVEGAKTDFALMKKVLNAYGISENHQVVSYNTKIYDLYQRMFFENDPASLDLLQVLKEHEADISKKEIFNRHYSDIILVFDLDPQDPGYSPEKITELTSFFNESSDNGKLYLNYPMVESFYHMTSIPDSKFETYMASLDELKRKEYKLKVKQLCRIPYRRFASSKFELDTVIIQNLQKAQYITGQTQLTNSTDSEKILAAQLSELQKNHQMFVLCTCIFYIWDYNPKLLDGIAL